MAWYEILMDAIRTAAAIAVPVVVAVVGYKLSQRLKRLEAQEWRNQELIRARLSYYQAIAPQLNDLMCFFTFIGHWKDLTPPRVIQLKRELDREFFSALPLFSEDCKTAYDAFMDVCFSTFGDWGTDAKLRTGYVRRREALGDRWERAWEDLFTHREDQALTAEQLSTLRSAYGDVLGALADDVQLNERREHYVSARVSSNAH